MDTVASRVAKRYLAGLESNEFEPNPDDEDELLVDAVPPATPEDIALAVKTFEYKLSDAEQSHGSDHPYVTVSGKFQFRGMNILYSLSTSGDLDLAEAEISDESYPIAEMDDDAYEKWIQMYIGSNSHFDWHPILIAIQDNNKHLEGYIGDKIDDYHDREDYNRDPDRYYGVKGQFGP